MRTLVKTNSTPLVEVESVYDCSVYDMLGSVRSHTPSYDGNLSVVAEHEVIVDMGKGALENHQILSLEGRNDIVVCLQRLLLNGEIIVFVRLREVREFLWLLIPFSAVP